MSAVQILLYRLGELVAVQGTMYRLDMQLVVVLEVALEAEAAGQPTKLLHGQAGADQGAMEFVVQFPELAGAPRFAGGGGNGGQLLRAGSGTDGPHGPLGLVCSRDSPGLLGAPGPHGPLRRGLGGGEDRWRRWWQDLGQGSRKRTHAPTPRASRRRSLMSRQSSRVVRSRAPVSANLSNSPAAW